MMMNQNKYASLFVFLSWVVAVSNATGGINESQCACMFSKECKKVQQKLSKALRARMGQIGDEIDMSNPYVEGGTRVFTSNAKMACPIPALESNVAAYYTEHELNGDAPTCNDEPVVCIVESPSCTGYHEPVDVPEQERHTSLETVFAKFAMIGGKHDRTPLPQYLMEAVPEMSPECRESVEHAEDFCHFEALFYKQ